MDPESGEELEPQWRSKISQDINEARTALEKAMVVSIKAKLDTLQKNLQPEKKVKKKKEPRAPCALCEFEFPVSQLFSGVRQKTVRLWKAERHVIPPVLNADILSCKERRNYLHDFDGAKLCMFCLQFFNIDYAAITLKSIKYERFVEENKELLKSGSAMRLPPSETRSASTCTRNSSMNSLNSTKDKIIDENSFALVKELASRVSVSSDSVTRTKTTGAHGAIIPPVRPLSRMETDLAKSVLRAKRTKTALMMNHCEVPELKNDDVVGDSGVSLCSSLREKYSSIKKVFSQQARGEYLDERTDKKIRKRADVFRHELEHKNLSDNALHELRNRAKLVRESVRRSTIMGNGNSGSPVASPLNSEVVPQKEIPAIFLEEEEDKKVMKLFDDRSLPKAYDKLSDFKDGGKMQTRRPLITRRGLVENSMDSLLKSKPSFKYVAQEIKLMKTGINAFKEGSGDKNKDAAPLASPRRMSLSYRPTPAFTHSSLSRKKGFGMPVGRHNRIVKNLEEGSVRSRKSFSVTEKLPTLPERKSTVKRRTLPLRAKPAPPRNKGMTSNEKEILIREKLLDKLERAIKAADDGKEKVKLKLKPSSTVTRKVDNIERKPLVMMVTKENSASAVRVEATKVESYTVPMVISSDFQVLTIDNLILQPSVDKLSEARDNTKTHRVRHHETAKSVLAPSDYTCFNVDMDKSSVVQTSEGGDLKEELPKSMESMVMNNNHLSVTVDEVSPNRNEPSEIREEDNYSLKEFENSDLSLNVLQPTTPSSLKSDYRLVSTPGHLGVIRRLSSRGNAPGTPLISGETISNRPSRPGSRMEASESGNMKLLSGEGRITLTAGRSGSTSRARSRQGTISTRSGTASGKSRPGTTSIDDVEM